MATNDSLQTAPVIGAIIAGTCTFLGVIVANYWNSINHKINHQLNVQQAERLTKAAKKEELYLSMLQWQNQISSIYMLHLCRYTGKLTFNEIEQLILEKYGKNAGHFESISMLISIYFPELNFDLELILNIRNGLAKFLDPQGPKKFTEDEFCTEQECLDLVCNSFLKKLANIKPHSL